VFTAKIETPFDGNDTYGYPLTFHTKYGGKRDPKPVNSGFINYWNLLADIAFSLIGGLVVSASIYIVRKKRKTKNNLSK
jgi:LPXTG-motif cell wall-anchored protein